MESCFDVFGQKGAKIGAKWGFSSFLEKFYNIDLIIYFLEKSYFGDFSLIVKSQCMKIFDFLHEFTVAWAFKIN